MILLNFLANARKAKKNLAKMWRLRVFLFLLPITLATLTASQIEALESLDQYWQLNYRQRFGPANLVCNCQDFANGSFADCGWNEPQIPPTLPDGFFCQNGQLTIVRMTKINISRSFPTDLLKLTELTTLRIESSNLVGTLPSEISQLTKLQILILSNNSLTGAIPNSVSKLTRLFSLNLYNNNFTSVPDLSSSQLVEVILAKNNLAGDLSFLPNNATYVDLDSNQLTGTIPSRLFQNSMSRLSLKDNRLYGPPPTWLRWNFPSFCNLRNNSFNNCQTAFFAPGGINCGLSCRNDCLSDKPVDSAVCAGNIWVITQLNNTGKLTVNSDLVILGNLSLADTSVLQINNGIVKVLGNANLSGELIIVNRTGEVPIIYAEGGISGDFVAVGVENVKCAKTKIHRDEKSLAVLVRTDCGSRKAGIIAAITISVTFLVIFIGLVVLWQFYCFRQRILWRDDEHVYFR